MPTTLQTIWDYLDIPNKERVTFVAFKVCDENIKCFFYQNLITGEISVIEKSSHTLTIQKILKQLPTANNVFVRFANQETISVESEWDEERQKLVIKL